jgi:hypothetical protein
MGTYGWGERSVAIAVVEAVAAEAGCEPDELTSLYDAIDPDALERFFEVAGDGVRPDRRVAFTYAGYEVEVTGDRRIEVRRAEQAVVG